MGTAGEEGHQPIESQHRAMLRELAKNLDAIFNDHLPERRHGFVLLMFEFGDHPFSRMNYISNAKREDMLKAMREWLENAEKFPPRGEAGRYET